jgi:hypothetical protein
MPRVIYIHAPQILSLLLAAVSMAVWIVWAVVFGHDFLGWFPSLNFKAWSVVLRLDAIFLIVGCGAVMLVGKLIINNSEKWTGS